MKHSRAQRLWVFCLWLDHKRANLDEVDRDRWIRLYLKKQLDQREERDFHQWVQELAARQQVHA